MSVIKEFNKGFGNCIFMSREPKDIENTIMEKAEKAFTDVPTAIKVTPIDDLHDKLSLSFGGKDNDVEGTLMWHKAANGVHYVLTNLETQ